MTRRFFATACRPTTKLLLLLFLGWTPLHGQTPAVPSIRGLWGAETRLGIPVAGELTVDSRNGKWTASIAGFEVLASQTGPRLSFSLPGHQGSFRGHFNSTSHQLNGEWIQPGGVILDPQYATPVAFHLASDGVWKGIVVPLEQRLTVYLLISNNDGKMTAVISNPEGNFFRRRVYTVTQDGSDILLETNGKKFRGVYEPKGETLSIQLADWLPPFTLTRRNEEDAIGFYPRVPSDGRPWAYRPPTLSRDGWPVSTLQREGIREALIASLLNRILKADPASTSLKMHSLLIARHGKLVLEEYFYGFSGDRVHDMRSAGKTFAPVLMGAARQQGTHIGPATRVYSLFPEDAPFANPDDRKQSMTLRDIMTMTAGTACDDSDDKSPGNEDRMQSDVQQPDWYKYTLDLPMSRQPGGEQAVYCSGDLNLVGGAVAASTHTWLPDFFDDHLARPLQFGRYYLNLMPNGEAYMGGGAYVTPRDQLKLGQLYLAGGLWNGERVVSRDWVNDSTSFHARFAKDRSLGQEHEYGFGWHLHQFRSGGKVYKAFAAEGNGGQFVITIPALDLVVGITGGAYGEFDQWYRWELELVPEFIIPAIESR